MVNTPCAGLVAVAVVVGLRCAVGDGTAVAVGDGVVVAVGVGVGVSVGVAVSVGDGTGVDTIVGVAVLTARDLCATVTVGVGCAEVIHETNPRQVSVSQANRVDILSTPVLKCALYSNRSASIGLSSDARRAG